MINFTINHGLKDILNSICYNIKEDFDGVILISGGGMVRVGKSVLAQQVGAYCADRLKSSWSVDNIVFSGSELIQKAKTYPINSVFVYDEGRGELDTKKVMEEVTKILLDFFAECGMYNHVVIIVLPEFFDLPKGIAISRSEILLDVTRGVKEIETKEGEKVIKFERGGFRGYHRQYKKKLYILGKKDYNNYDCVKANFWGEFPNHFTVDKEAYLEKKRIYLARQRGKGKQEVRLHYAMKLLLKHIPATTLEKEFKALGLELSNTTIERIATDLQEN